jgi:hypothetical protein
MRISTGMAEIGVNYQQGGRVSPGKAYIWPEYHADRIDGIEGAAGKKKPDFFYTKPLPAEREKIFELMNNRAGRGYTSTGKPLGFSPELRPGSLFDAIA